MEVICSNWRGLYLPKCNSTFSQRSSTKQAQQILRGCRRGSRISAQQPTASLIPTQWPEATWRCACMHTCMRGAHTCRSTMTNHPATAYSLAVRVSHGLASGLPGMMASNFSAANKHAQVDPRVGASMSPGAVASSMSGIKPPILLSNGRELQICSTT
jgi:hypothetical protein